MSEENTVPATNAADINAAAIASMIEQLANNGSLTVGDFTYIVIDGVITYHRTSLQTALTDDQAGFVGVQTDTNSVEADTVLGTIPEPLRRANAPAPIITAGATWESTSPDGKRTYTSKVTPEDKIITEEGTAKMADRAPGRNNMETYQHMENHRRDVAENGPATAPLAGRWEDDGARVAGPTNMLFQGGAGYRGDATAHESREAMLARLLTETETEAEEKVFHHDDKENEKKGPSENDNAQGGVY